MVASLWIGSFRNFHPCSHESRWGGSHSDGLGRKLIITRKITTRRLLIKISLMPFPRVLNWILLKAYCSITFPLILSTIFIALDGFNTFVFHTFVFCILIRYCKGKQRRATEPEYTSRRGLLHTCSCPTLRQRPRTPK